MTECAPERVVTVFGLSSPPHFHSEHTRHLGSFLSSAAVILFVAWSTGWSQNPRMSSLSFGKNL